MFSRHYWNVGNTPYEWLHVAVRQGWWVFILLYSLYCVILLMFLEWPLSLFAWGLVSGCTCICHAESSEIRCTQFIFLFSIDWLRRQLKKVVDFTFKSYYCSSVEFLNVNKSNTLENMLEIWIHSFSISPFFVQGCRSGCLSQYVLGKWQETTQQDRECMYVQCM